jgi:hypothetical protein
MIVRASAVLVALALAACQPSAPAQPAPPPLPAAPPAAVAPGEPPPFEVALQPPAAARAGEAATARVVLRARGGFHVNRDYPMAFRPEPGSVAAFGAERVALGDGAERTPCAAEPEEACAVAAPLAFTLKEPGEARLAGTLAFSVCTKEICRIEKVPLALAVTASR